MSTQLQIVNVILKRLREDTVASVTTTDYAALIAQWVNDAKTEMENLHYEWSAYITEIDTTILADGSTRVYDLTDTNDRSWLMHSSLDDRIPQAFDITSGEQGQLYTCPLKDLQQVRALSSTTKTDSRPTAFAIKNDTTNRGWSIELFWPVGASDSARSWRTYWYVPQADLALDGTADDTQIKLPSYPITLMALYYAINERGEEMGQPGGIAFSRAQAAIAGAVENDMVVNKRSDEPAAQFSNNEYL